jgi:hypothetical protein
MRSSNYIVLRDVAERDLDKKMHGEGVLLWLLPSVLGEGALYRGTWTCIIGGVFVEESVSVAKKLNIDCVTFSVCVLS